MPCDLLGILEVATDPIRAIHTLSNYDCVLIDDTDNASGGKSLDSERILEMFEQRGNGKDGPQLTALIRTNVNVQELTVRALMTENREHIYHAAMMDPHTAAELDVDQIWNLVDDLIEAHGDWLPGWARGTRKQRVA